MTEASVGELVSGVRKKRDLTQRNIAVRLGVTTQHLSNVETGRTIPSDEFCILLAQKVLDIDPGLMVLYAHRDKVPARVKGVFTAAIIARERKVAQMGS